MLRLIFITLFTIASAALATGQQAKQEPPVAPQFALKDLSGKTASLSEYKGKVLLLNFWATWCAPCRREMPDLIKWQKEYQSRGLQIIGITHLPYRRSDVQRVVRQMKVNYPVLLGTDELAALYKVDEVLPVTIVIDREGKVRSRILGILMPEEFEQTVKPLLD